MCQCDLCRDPQQLCEQCGDPFNHEAVYREITGARKFCTDDCADAAAEAFELCQDAEEYRSDYHGQTLAYRFSTSHAIAISEGMWQE